MKWIRNLTGFERKISWVAGYGLRTDQHPAAIEFSVKNRMGALVLRVTPTGRYIRKEERLLVSISEILPHAAEGDNETTYYGTCFSLLGQDVADSMIDKSEDEIFTGLEELHTKLIQQEPNGGGFHLVRKGA